MTLSSDSKDGDFFGWLLCPASDPSKYLTIYRSDEGPREEFRGKYRFGKDHSIIIDAAQRYHEGTYFAEYKGGHQQRIVLIVNG